MGQINTIIGDFKGNSEKILSSTNEAASKGARLIVFPEMCICGYPPMDLLDHDTFAQKNLNQVRWLQKNLPENIAVAVGHVDRNPENKGKHLRNVVSVIYNGKIIHIQSKSLLPTYDVFDETRYFFPSESHRTFSFDGEKIGVAICEDLWWEQDVTPQARYGIDPVKELLDDGATLILAPSASPYFSEKLKIRYSIISKISRTSGVPVVYVNMVGGNDSLIFDGNSIVTDGNGNLVFHAPAFREETGIIDTAGGYPPLPLEIDRYKEIEDALVTGLKDYIIKCGFSKVHLGLSGGIDSALAAVIAVKAVGPENVKAFALPSRYSSPESEKDASLLAHNLGISFDVISIEGIFPAYLKALEPHFGGREMDLAEENLQARIRGTLLMGYSNKWNSLLLTTGNKSELGTGYCTLYGDMSGSIAVIGDLLKTEVYALSRYINRDREIIPNSIITKAPSAELRYDQTDQDSLPPYPVLDEILKLYVLDNLTKEEIVRRGFEEEVVKKILHLVGKAEYKRRQAPPVLKVSPRAFGTGRRVPIARKIYEA